MFVDEYSRKKEIQRTFFFWTGINIIFPRCRGLLRLGRFRRRRYLAMYLYIPVCVALKLRSLPFTHPVYVAPRYFQ